MKIKQILGTTVREEKEQNCPRFCLPNCYIGLEYEWEGCGQFQQPTLKFNEYFTTHADGSLRDNGIEFVFNGPLAGTQLLTGIEMMDELSRKYNFKASYRTSLHCHLDMTEMNFPEDVYMIGMLYCIFEPLIYKYIGNSRDICNYCIPWYSHPQHYSVFINALRRKFNAPSDYASLLKSSKQYKYSGLNFFSLGDFGTVEWRHAPVNMQKDKIIQWINIIMRHKKFVLEHRKAVPDWLLTYASRMSPNDFLIEVFDSEAKALGMFTKNLRADFDIGLATATHYLSLLKGQQ